MSKPLQEKFKEQCKKFDINPENYVETFTKKVGKSIKTEEAVICYVDTLHETKEEMKKPKKSMADKLVELGKKNFLFLDQYGTPHARLVLPWVTNDTNDTNDGLLSSNLKNNSNIITNNIDDKKNIVNIVSVVKNHLEVMPLESKKFQEYLADLMWQNENKVPNSGALQSALTVLSGTTRRKNNKYLLYNRVAPDPNGNGIWIDMAAKNWRAIHITSEGWKIIDEPPLLFKRHAHQNPLPIPTKVSDTELTNTINKLVELINLPNDKNDKIMFLTSCFSFFVPKIAHPIIHISGCHGSAKSTLFKILKEIIDPSKHETLTVARNKEGLIQQLAHSYFPVFDNISRLKDWCSDIFCQATTGAGFSKRKHYTNDDDFIYNFKRCIGLNGINLVAQKPDLLDRTIIFVLLKIPKTKRRTENEILTELTRLKPAIFGAILGIIAKAIQIEKNLVLPEKQRLADFTRWGCAIAIALGYTQEEFLRAYAVKVGKQTDEALQASPIAVALMAYCVQNVQGMSDGEGNLDFILEKEPTDLYREVTEFAEQNGLKTRKTYWPNASNAFMRQLNKVKPNLEEKGYIIKNNHDGDKRTVIIDITLAMREKQNATQDNSLWENENEL